MSIEEIDTQRLYDRKELQKLSLRQLCKLLSIPLKHLKECGFSKDNLIEMFLTNTAEQ